jgi:hypothetical protein
VGLLRGDQVLRAVAIKELMDSCVTVEVVFLRVACSVPPYDGQPSLRVLQSPHQQESSHICGSPDFELFKLQNCKKLFFFNFYFLTFSSQGYYVVRAGCKLMILGLQTCATMPS